MPRLWFLIAVAIAAALTLCGGRVDTAVCPGSESLCLGLDSAAWCCPQDYTCGTNMQCYEHAYDSGMAQQQDDAPEYLPPPNPPVPMGSGSGSGAPMRQQ